MFTSINLAIGDEIFAAAVDDDGEDDNYKGPTNFLFEHCPFNFNDFSPPHENINV